MSIKGLRRRISMDEIAIFPADSCHCHWHCNYGFVPEAGCEQHDTAQFIAFMDKVMRQQRGDGSSDGITNDTEAIP